MQLLTRGLMLLLLMLFKQLLCAGLSPRSGRNFMRCVMAPDLPQCAPILCIEASSGPGCRSSLHAEVPGTAMTPVVFLLLPAPGPQVTQKAGVNLVQAWLTAATC